MLRAFAAFLSIFCALGLLLRVQEMASVFGAASLAVFAIDIWLADSARNPHRSRTRGEPLV